MMNESKRGQKKKQHQLTHIHLMMFRIKLKMILGKSNAMQSTFRWREKEIKKSKIMGMRLKEREGEIKNQEKNEIHLNGKKIYEQINTSFFFNSVIHTKHLYYFI